MRDAPVTTCTLVRKNPSRGDDQTTALRVPSYGDLPGLLVEQAGVVRHRADGRGDLGDHILEVALKPVHQGAGALGVDPLGRARRSQRNAHEEHSRPPPHDCSLPGGRSRNGEGPA